MKIKITYLATVIASVLFLLIGHKIATDGLQIFQDTSHEIVRAKVQGVVERVQPPQDFFDDNDDYDEEDGLYDDFFLMMMGERIIFEAKITNGKRKGEIVNVTQSLSGFSKQDKIKEVDRGNSVVIINVENEWYFNGYLRTNRLLGLGILFVLCVLLFGGRKGFNTILSLGMTCAAIFAVFLPAILSGKNIYAMSLIVCVYVIAMTLLIVIGFNKKSLASVIGCASGVFVTAIITLVMDKLLFLTGIVDEHSRYLTNLPIGASLNLRAIIFAGIIIGAMGAIMDVAISISSALWEIKEKAGNIKFETLFRSGLNIGRDIMGSMANTLILAYIGSTLSVVILISVYSNSLLGLFNSEMIVVEILQALAGSLGILFAMPLTAFFCSVIYLKEKKEIKRE